MPATRTPSSARERIHLWWDLFIIVLVIANLALLLFDSLFLIPPLNTALEAVTPGLHAAYEQNIHANFLSIDLAFVAVLNPIQRVIGFPSDVQYVGMATAILVTKGLRPLAS